MFRSFSFLFLVSAVFSYPAFAKEITVESSLIAATVYTNRAQLTRSTDIDIPKGSHTLIFKGLPVSMLTDSLRAKGEASGTVTLGALTHKRVIEADLTPPREKALNAELDSIQDQKKLIQAEKQAIAIQKTFLTNLGKNAVLRENEDIAQVNLKPETWGSAAKALHTEMSALLKQDIAYNIQLRTLTKQEQKIQREMSQLRTGQRATYQVTVPFESDRATTLTLRLDYQVPNASWTPLYDARLDTQTEDLNLVLYGAVRQNTGEDWNNVSLTLSTAQPHRGASQADLGSMWVNFSTYGDGNNFNLIASNTVSRSSILGSVMETNIAMDSLANAPKKQAVMVQATINTGGFISEYKITGPSTVLADGSESKLLVGNFKTENKLHIEIKPQLSRQAMLVSRAKLLGDAPILAGQVNLFRDGAYVGQMYMPLLRPQEEQNLAFGIDDNVSVVRRALKDERSEEGLIGRDSVLERHFLTEITNLHKDPIDIVVLQNTPASQNKDIEVTLLKNVTSAGYEMDADKIKGLMRWTITLPSKAKKGIKLGWKVSWPSDKQISGL